MAESRESKPARREDTDKALSLEVARLFGLSPKMMMAPRPTPDDRPAADDEPDPEPNAETPDS